MIDPNATNPPDFSLQFNCSETSGGVVVFNCRSVSGCVGGCGGSGGGDGGGGESGGEERERVEVEVSTAAEEMVVAAMVVLVTEAALVVKVAAEEEAMAADGEVVVANGSAPIPLAAPNTALWCSGWVWPQSPPRNHSGV